MKAYANNAKRRDDGPGRKLVARRQNPDGTVSNIYEKSSGQKPVGKAAPAKAKSSDAAPAKPKARVVVRQNLEEEIQRPVEQLKPRGIETKERQWGSVAEANSGHGRTYGAAKFTESERGRLRSKGMSAEQATEQLMSEGKSSQYVPSRNKKWGEMDASADRQPDYGGVVKRYDGQIKRLPGRMTTATKQKK